VCKVKPIRVLQGSSFVEDDMSQIKLDVVCNFKDEIRSHDFAHCSTLAFYLSEQITVVSAIANPLQSNRGHAGNKLTNAKNPTSGTSIIDGRSKKPPRSESCFENHLRMLPQ
jgi:hypothetical protein